ncbi:MAG: DUF523 domain-containing protein [Erysipelotrichaceae bacterium]|uniref:DUF523 domain-containing protein n=1 Tax=Floccifex sp. TaxID=2815810 RepID=UPI002A75AA8C|nr:DUF523 domain-containing protein [Floccifex sp.]MDD7282274.1 DUF523 domain-containing protein [Erysipelotrichaceae bacterium]MDY2958222.1 DUF523 domain-containing protein [Floccifex sp.]
MKVLVSACLLGNNCKYNGKNNYNEKVFEKFKDDEIIPVCPECLGGLPTPRIPSEIVDQKVINKQGIDVTKEFVKGAHLALDIALSNKVDVAILQSRSPSCGVKEVYDGTFSGTKKKGQGIFTQLLVEHGIKVIDVEDL